MKSLTSLILLAGLTLMVIGASLASAQDTVYLELSNPAKSPIPPNCSTWTEFYPNPGVIHHQDDYVDNSEDGEMAFCDYIMLDGVWNHIEWVGPTYHLSCGVYEPWDNPNPTGDDPTCETWIEIYPEHGNLWHVDGFQDNGDGLISPCDMVLIAGVWCHIDDIGLNIRTKPGTPVDNENKTWGEIKEEFE